MKSDSAVTSQGWFRAMRTPEAMELLAASPDAFLLAYVIAYRAQWSDRFNRHNLAKGEALLGDYRGMGLTERRYRTAKALLAKWQFATFKATNKGTVGKLTDSRLFDIVLSRNDEQGDGREPDKRRAADERPTTTDEQDERNEQYELEEVGAAKKPPAPRKPKTSTVVDEDYLTSLQADPIYARHNVRLVFGKMCRT